MLETKTISLAGVSYTISSPLTLGQLIDLQVAAVMPPLDDQQENVRRGAERNVAILVAGLKSDYPEINAKALIEMRITRDEFAAAVSAVLDISGLLPKDQPAGEAQAEAA
jgi:hypothetical protein